MSTYDYVIVGAGSAGCVLANRLTADPNVRVAILEAGGSDRSVLIQMPTALSIPMNMPRYNWGFESEPEPYLDRRRMDCPRGKTLGGSSSINGMVYVRGHARDFDQWEREGAHEWGYRNCLPYFQRAETWTRGGDSYRGAEGPLHTCNGNEMRNPLYEAFIRAGEEAGYGLTDDYNGFRQEGFGPMHMTVKDGVRWSTANAYLRPAMQRPNLTVITDTLVHKILFEGDRAIGVRYQQGARLADVFADAEVILSAGSIGSPTLLQRSGIGPENVLRRAGVDVRVDRAGVGENLQDHLEVYLQYQCTQPITLNGELGTFSKAGIGARWILFKDGLGATNHFESCAFIRSQAGVEWPDIQYHFLPAAIRYDGRAAFSGHGFQVHVGPNKPMSRGHVRIRSADPEQRPLVLFNYMQHERDIECFRQCVTLTREIMAQPALDAFRGPEIQPGEVCVEDADIDAWIRANAESAYHPSCSCKMGAADDPMAVVDNECRVIGAEALRVVDSSIFPTITNGNLNGPTIMTAERAADIIRGAPMLAASNAPTWIDPEWETRQRTGAPVRAPA
ncbi:MAG: choline dehydrogenase [Gammaproteobacteria bacterium]|nr:choline dehydrogenase [Gammaproteobacteria bacterium]